MNKQLYFVEVGVLLNKTHPEFECYQISNFYDQFGFYDENRLTFTTLNKALKYAKKYVEDGVNNTYVIVYTFVCNIDDEELQEIKDIAYSECSLENPSIETTIFFQYKTQYGLINTVTDIEGVM